LFFIGTTLRAARPHDSDQLAPQSCGGRIPGALVENSQALQRQWFGLPTRLAPTKVIAQDLCCIISAIHEIGLDLSMFTDPSWHDRVDRSSIRGLSKKLHEASHSALYV
jgi:hypothetical protein